MKTRQRKLWKKSRSRRHKKNAARTPEQRKARAIKREKSRKKRGAQAQKNRQFIIENMGRVLIAVKDAGMNSKKWFLRFFKNEKV